MSLKTSGAVVMAVLWGACATVNTPVPVVGPQEDVADLAGVWRGSYESTATERSGVIEFRLEAGQDTAFGTVVMMPGPDPDDPTRYDRIAGPAPEWLDINFVRCEAGAVTGSLGPYVDRRTAQTLRTTFQGFVTGDRIEGTYTTRVQTSGDEFTGRWRVERTDKPGGA